LLRLFHQIFNYEKIKQVFKEYANEIMTIELLEEQRNTKKRKRIIGPNQIPP